MKKQPAFARHPSRVVTALSVSPNQEDHLGLWGIFSHSNWVLLQADGVTRAAALLREREIGVVICERDLAPGTWLDLMDRVARLPSAPPLIVTSRQADNALWAEALNQGAYDVLPKPFDRETVVRSVRMAWLHWIREPQRTGAHAPRILGAAG